MALSKEIINWYLKHKRDLPWRNTTDPYFIWLSEVILQQTRVDQGMPYYLKFTERYKSVKQLAAAKDDEIMKMWQGLGYYNRAANMLKTARLVVSEHKAVFPKTYNELIQLKGIGPYTAAAISSFAFNEVQAVVDGNVYRVLSRLFAIDEPINSSKGKVLFAELAKEVLDHKHPGTYNQAIMELGAIVCKPRNPLCEKCPVRLQCIAYNKKTIDRYPVKIKKSKPRDRYLSYFFIDQKNKTFIIQRKESAIWKGLYEFPNIETEQALNEHGITSQPAFTELFGSKEAFTIQKLFSAKHQLSHQTIYANFFRLTSAKKIKPIGKDYIHIDTNNLNHYAVPRLFDKFLNFLTLHMNH